MRIRIYLPNFVFFWSVYICPFTNSISYKKLTKLRVMNIST